VNGVEVAAREGLVSYARSLFDRRLTHGRTGNLSVRLDDGWVVTPTGASLGRLDPATLARLDAGGRHVGGDPPSKESALHLAVYDARPAAEAVVHLHATHSVAVSCLADVDPSDVLAPLTAYYAMRVGTLPLVPYHPPGAPELADALRSVVSRHHAVLLANHGPVVAGTSLEAAVDALEELEETARLALLLHGRPVRPLTPEQAAPLRHA
jgi:3-dehydro-4-phosphotetronate decarboxylase